jgi:heptosyltransferase-3
MMKKILLVRFGGLGDLLAVAPSVQLLHRQFPAARLVLACREEYGNFLREIGLVDDVLRADGPRWLPLFSGSASSDEDAERWFRSFDLVVAWMQGGKGGELENRLIAVAGAQKGRVISYGRDEKGDAIIPFFFRETERLLESFDKSWAGRRFEEYVRLPVPDVFGKRCLSLLGLSGESEERFAVVHPGSGSASKRWPLRNFLEVVEDLGRKGLGGALVTGEAETALERLFDRTDLPSGWVRLPSPSLGALAGLLIRAAFYLGNDSGITHLASACGTQVIAIFRSEFTAVWRPFGRVHLLSADSPEMISVEEVLKKIAGLNGLGEFPRTGIG